MRDVVIVDAVRSPIGRRNGSLAGTHPAELLATVLRQMIGRTGIDPAEVGQVVGGCVGAVGEQSYNIVRNAWLAAGLPPSVAGTTVDSQCGSGQQAVDLAVALVGSGAIDVAVGCGVESMSRVPMGSSTRAGPGEPLSAGYFEHYASISQFEAAERIADKWGVTRSDSDAFALESQLRAARAWDEGRFEAEVVPIEVADHDGDGQPLSTSHMACRDEGLRQTTLEKLATLKPVIEDGVHTAGSSSQISDAAAAVLLMSAERAAALNLTPLARVVDHGLVGSDPVMKLTGPIDATHHILRRSTLSITDLDIIEINEAFSSVVLAWEREFRPDMERVNPNGGAIALGHPLGGSGARLVTTAVHELRRTDQNTAFVTMCCGGGLGTATLLERI